MPNSSHSRLLDMPAEAMEACFSLLDAVSLVTCRLICKKIKKLIDRSETLRYILALNMCGMSDNPSISCSIPLQERVTRLRRYDDARKELSFSTYRELPLSAGSRVVVSGGYVIAMGAGKVTVHRPASKLRGIESRTWSFSFEQQCEDAGVDSERDLLAIVSDMGNHKQELHFLSLATGNYHPSAFKARIALGRDSPRIVGERVFYNKRVYDWRTGKTCAFETDELVVLSDEHALKFDLDEDDIHSSDVGWPCPIFKAYRVPPLTLDESLSSQNQARGRYDSSVPDAMKEPARAILTFPCFSSLTLHYDTGIQFDNALMPYSADRDGIFYTDTNDRIIRVDIVFTGHQGDDPNPSISILLWRSLLLRYVASSDVLPSRVGWNAWSTAACIGPSRRYPFVHGKSGPRALVNSRASYNDLYSVGSCSDSYEEEYIAGEDEESGSGPRPIRVRDYHRRRTSRPVNASKEPFSVVAGGEHKSYLKRDWIGEASSAEEYEEEEKPDIWEGVRPTLPVNTSSWKYIATERDPPPELKGKAGGKYLLLDDGLVYVEKQAEKVTAHIFTY
ncbi:hypothetical protein PENSPDRAFT_300876 [Peniophora sp. CONT]|nr:hypothetical protein PENSPDRAFT_300876 [Peniophora sp. CONT]